VLEYNDRPGEKTHQHRHPAFVLYALSRLERTLTLPGGKMLRRAFIVELKKLREGCAKP